MTCVCGGHSLENKLGWGLFAIELEELTELHAIPHNDTMMHQPNDACWCEPGIDEEADGLLFVHNAHDGREAIMTGLRKPS